MVEEEEEEESEPELEPELTAEDIERIEKLRKVKQLKCNYATIDLLLYFHILQLEELNRVWPWGDEIKPVYKWV